MNRTSLTIGGFNQPSLAQTLIETPGNCEKGLSQRFLWMFPKPIHGRFSTLEPIEKTFTDKIGDFISLLQHSQEIFQNSNTGFLCFHAGICSEGMGFLWHSLHFYPGFYLVLGL